MREECVEVGDEEWQLSKDSADAATAGFNLLSFVHQINICIEVEQGSQCVVREKAKSGIKTVTEVLSSL
jgi:hypothetical protein